MYAQTSRGGLWAALAVRFALSLFLRGSGWGCRVGYSAVQHGLLVAAGLDSIESERWLIHA
jgi:hypothetical protein